jgi:hypothetical protein
MGPRSDELVSLRSDEPRSMSPHDPMSPAR